MTKKHITLLIILSAIWGSSFMFMKLLSPVLGPVLTASLRLMIGGIFLLIVFKVSKVKIEWKRQWKMILLIGVISQGIPYFLFAFAALYIQSNISVVMNSTSPIFGLVLSSLFLSEKFKPIQLLGVLLGTSGVIILSASNNTGTHTEFLIGVSACLLASFLYGLSSVLIRSKAKEIDSKVVASIGQVFASLFLIPFIILFPPTGTVTFNTALLLIVFGIVCSGIAGLIYFKLIVECGPVKALTVTYLMPVFGFFWGYLVLDEQITSSLIIGGITIVIGTIFITQRKNP